MLPNWLTIVDAQVSCFPMKNKAGQIITDEKGKPKWLQVGPWVLFGDGCIWQFSNHHGSITCHHPRQPKRDKAGNLVFEVKRAAFAPVPVYEKETKDRYKDWDHLVKVWENHPLGAELIEALERGVVLAKENQAAKLAAARAA